MDDLVTLMRELHAAEDRKNSLDDVSQMLHLDSSFREAPCLTPSGVAARLLRAVCPSWRWAFLFLWPPAERQVVQVVPPGQSGGPSSCPSPSASRRVPARPWQRRTPLHTTSVPA